MRMIPSEHLKSVPYLDTSCLAERTVKLMPLWDGQIWHLWVPIPGGFMDCKPVDAMMVDYVALGAAKETDLLIPFVELMWQRASWPEVCSFISAISQDFHHMGTSVAKLKHVFRTRNMVGDRASLFAATELEYLLILTRSVFDLLQETIARIWNRRVRLHDPLAEKRRKSRALPETFSKVVLREKAIIRTPEEIEACFGLPEVLARAYATHATFFSELRDARDAIVHGSGAALGYIFNTERGFCVSRLEAPFNKFPGWSDDHRYNANLVSVLPWVAHIVLGTIFACNALMEAFAIAVTLPPELAPGYHVFVRGPCNDALVEVLDIANGGSSWWEPSPDVAPLRSNRSLAERTRERAYFLWREKVGDRWWDADANWLSAETIERGLADAG